MIIDTDKLREKLEEERHQERNIMNLRLYSVLSDLYYLERIENIYKDLTNES